ncbi:MAG: DUF1015 domain-containing protein [Candidatus Omnitrophica bacterium]|nr:DUF1015 domain-containing protein [Candidatus Omnitrophota bacterium]
MAKIKPFSALFYNQEKIKDISKVVCPPYDVIDTAQQEFYHTLSPYNIIHLILGKDIAGQDKYTRAKERLRTWINEKILVTDTSECVYFYLQEYKIKGERKTRLGFISLLSLDDKNSIFSHEHTRIEPKEDRLRLLEAVQANLSPIFVLFQDKNRIILRIYEQYIEQKTPLIELTDQENILHKLWRIDEPYLLDLIQRSMRDRNIFIADGHHRYEVAVTYRNYLREKQKVCVDEEKDYDYIMAYFTNIESRGLVIIPVHRLIKNVELDDRSFMDRIKDYFEPEEIKDKHRFFFCLEKAGLTQPTLGLYKEAHYFILRLKSLTILDKIIKDKPRQYRRLDVSILNYIILKEVLNIEPEDKERVKFDVDAEKLIMQADKNSMVFLLNPVKIEEIIEIASAGYRLPPKSTYFYPKVLSGLLINKLNV